MTYLSSAIRKRQVGLRRWGESSIHMLEGAGFKGSKPRPFTYEAAIWQFKSWCYAAASLNAQRAASQPLRLYLRKRGRGKSIAWNTREVPRGRKAYLLGDGAQQPSKTVLNKIMEVGDDFEEVTDAHPVIELLTKTNPFMNGFEQSFLRFLYLELTGNAYLHPVFGRGSAGPAELWPMPAHWTWVIPDRVDFVRGYLYGKTMVQALEFAPDEVIHFKRPNPANLHYGLGKIEAGWGVVSQNEAIHEMDLATFDNHARPDFAVIVKSGATADQLDAFAQHVEEKLRGRRKAGSFLPITGDVTLTPLNFPPKDLTGREEIVEEIAAVFGTPVTLLKANDPNLASAQTGFMSWRENTILPILRLDEEVLNQSLLPLFGIEDDAVLAYDNPVPADREFELKQREVHSRIGLVSLNEQRAEIGLEPVEGGDEIRVPMGQQPLSGQNPFGSFNLSREPEVKQQKPDNPQVNPRDLLDIIRDVQANNVPRDAAVSVMMVAFGIDEATAERLLGSAGRNPDGRTGSEDRGPEPEADKGLRRGESNGLPEGEDVPCGVPHGVVNGEDAGGGGEEPSTDKGLSEQGGRDGDSQDNRLIKQSDLWRGLKRVCCKNAEDSERDGESEQMVQRWTSVIVGLLAVQRDTLMQRIQSLKGKKGKKSRRSEVQRILEEVRAEFGDQVADASEPFISQVIQLGGSIGNTRIGVEGMFDVTNPNVAAFIREYTMRLAGSVAQTTVDALSQTLGEGLDSGESIQQLAVRVRQLDETAFSGYRAEMIARTESARAYTAGEEVSWRESGIVEGKRWLLAANACEFCVAAASSVNDRTTPLGEPFFKRGTNLQGASGNVMRLDYSDVDAAPLHPHCRCDLVPVMRSAE